MNCDAAVTIGKGHRVCEDFCRYNAEYHGDTPPSKPPYVIVADGCSDPTAPDTNIGAMLLTLATETFIEQTGFHKHAIDAAARIRAALHLHPLSLDATLLTASLVRINEKPHVYVSAHGDGVVAAVRNDGGIEVVNLVYPSGIPFYLNYTIDDDRKASMLKAASAKLVEAGSAGLIHEGGGNPLMVDRWLIHPDDGTEEHVKMELACPRPLWEQHFPCDQYRFVGVMSDGVHKVIRIEPDGRYTTRPFLSVVKTLMTFNNALAGDFMQRRMNVLMRECKKGQFEFLDDLSAGVIYCGW